MWLFNKRISFVESGVFQGFTDWHCHLLHGVDDGVQTMDESLQILALYEKLGIREVWLTPHIMEDMPNTISELKARFEELKQSYTGSIILHLSAEYMLDNLFEKLLQKNDLLPLGKDGNHLLVETSYFNPPMGLKNILLRIKSKGYTPVLAHPERYNYMDENNYRELIEIGIKFQANIPSLCNTYGSMVRRKLEWLLREDMVNMWGTDTHHSNVFSKLIVEKILKQSISLKLK